MGSKAQITRSSPFTETAYGNGKKAPRIPATHNGGSGGDNQMRTKWISIKSQLEIPFANLRFKLAQADDGDVMLEVALPKNSAFRPTQAGREVRAAGHRALSSSVRKEFALSTLRTQVFEWRNKSI